MWTNVWHPGRIVLYNLRSFLIIIFVVLEPYINTAGSVPFLVHDQNPFVLIFGLPSLPGAKTVGGGETQFNVSANVTNTLNIEQFASESLFVDTEIYALDLVWQYGLNDVWNLRITLPFLSYQAGKLDGFIEDFHDLFSFPGGDRPNQPHNRLLIRYVLDNSTLVEINSPQTGVGDLAVSLGWQYMKTPVCAVSLWSSLKLPTGEKEKLTGSGGTDLAIWLSGQQLINNPWEVFGATGLVWTQRGKVVALQRQQIVVFGNMGIDWRVLSWLSLKIQTDAHSSFYDDTSTKFLGAAMQLTAGGSLHFNPKTVLDVAVTEDVLVDSAPDVSFLITLRTSF
jgi:hypothetical protein